MKNMPKKKKKRKKPPNALKQNVIITEVLVLNLGKEFQRINALKCEIWFKKIKRPSSKNFPLLFFSFSKII